MRFHLKTTLMALFVEMACDLSCSYFHLSQGSCFFDVRSVTFIPFIVGCERCKALRMCSIVSRILLCSLFTPVPYFVPEMRALVGSEQGADRGNEYLRLDTPAGGPCFSDGAVPAQQPCGSAGPRRLYRIPVSRCRTQEYSSSSV